MVEVGTEVSKNRKKLNDQIRKSKVPKDYIHSKTPY